MFLSVPAASMRLVLAVVCGYNIGTALLIWVLINSVDLC